MQSFIYDPRGVLSNATAEPARRVAKLDNLRLGVLNNTKWNAAKLLAAVVELLRQEVNFAEVNVFKKETYTRNAAPELLERMAACSDIALVAIGD